MTVVVRFVQQVRPSDMAAYLGVEQRFVDWARRLGAIQGRRLRVVSASEPVDTLVWEGTYPTRAAAIAALGGVEADTEHDALWSEQVRYVVARRVEILDVLDFAASVAPG